MTELVANRVRQLRLERKWSAQQLADECARAGYPALTRSTIAKIESGARKSVTAEELAALADVLGVTANDLLQPVNRPRTIRRLPAGELEYVQELLADADAAQLLATAMQAVGSDVDVQSSSEQTDKYRAMVDQLTSLPDYTDGLPAILALVDYAARHTPEPSRSQLATWVEQQARHLGLESELRSLRVRTTPPPPASRLTLMIAIDHDAIDPDKFIVSYWRQEDPDEWPPPRGGNIVTSFSDLERRVDELVQDAEVAWASRANKVGLEFVLPRSLLGLPVHLWHKELDSNNPRLLCLDYSIVVRSLERMIKQQWYRVWHLRWQQLTAAPSPDLILFNEPTDRDGPIHLNARFSDPQWSAVVLTQAPPPDPHPGIDVLNTAIRSGIPMIVWLREGSPEALHAVMERITEDDGLADVPTRVQALRREAYVAPEAADATITRDLVVLWDDPYRVVEISSTAAPSETSSDTGT